MFKPARMRLLAGIGGGVCVFPDAVSKIGDGVSKIGDGVSIFHDGV